MTHLTNGNIATDLDDHTNNHTLLSQGYSIRHIETWHNTDHSCIIWDAPEINLDDLPF